MLKKKLLAIVFVIAALALVAAACTPAATIVPATVPPTREATAAPPPTQAPAPTVAPTAAPTAIPTQAPAPTAVSPTQAPKVTFTGTDAEEEGYWYSRYNLGNLVMRSGLGDTFMPEKEMVKQMIQMVDTNRHDGDTAMPPLHVTLLQSVYASGDPHYIKSFNPDDFATQRWDPATFDKTVTSRALGWTMIKENEWAKQFHVDFHFGTPKDDFGAQYRFVGMVLNAESKMQAQFALKKLKNEQGLIANSDGKVDWAGQWVMLEAFSDLAGTLSPAKLPHSESNRYHDPATAKMFQGAADMLFGALRDRQPADSEEASLAVQGLTWYAANTANAADKAQAIVLIGQFGDVLAKAKPTTAAGHATVIRGVIEAYRTTKQVRYLQAASAHFAALSASFNAQSGVFRSQNRYTIDNVATIMGALNSLKLFAGDAVDQKTVEAIFTRFYESAVNQSGLQQSAPPIPVAKGKFEQDEPKMYYAYPGIPVPPKAGGKFGIAPVFATSVTWDGEQWSVSDGRFDSAGAMHAANEFIWFHNDEVNGFPAIEK